MPGVREGEGRNVCVRKKSAPTIEKNPKK